MPNAFLPERVTAARNKLKWSQRKLAAAVGCSAPTINDYEHGRKRPSMSTLEKLSEVLQESMFYFYGQVEASGLPVALGLAPGETIAEVTPVPGTNLVMVPKDVWERLSRLEERVRLALTGGGGLGSPGANSLLPLDEISLQATQRIVAMLRGELKKTA